MDRRIVKCWPGLVLVLSLVILSCGDDNGERPNVEFEFTPSLLPIGIKDQPYSEVVSVSGGTGPYTWTVDPADLPPGTNADPAAESLTIAGTPTTAETFTFTVRVEDANGASTTKTFTIQVVDSFDLGGDWSFTIDVTAAYGVCEGEENADPSTDTITVTQTASGTPGIFNVTMTGFLGNPAYELTGTMTGAYITVSGSYPEDGGTTTTTHNLVVTAPNTIAGEESWTWSGPGGDCPNGRASVTASRL